MYRFLSPTVIIDIYFAAVVNPTQDGWGPVGLIVFHHHSLLIENIFSENVTKVDQSGYGRIFIWFHHQYIVLHISRFTGILYYF